jgi:glutamine amidotransferase
MLALRELHPEIPAFQAVSEETSLVVSEPLGGLPRRLERGARVEAGVIQEGADELDDFVPRAA